MAVKDMSPVSGMPLCVGSSQCSPLQENDDYPAARLRAAGAIIVGTTVNAAASDSVAATSSSAVRRSFATATGDAPKIAATAL